MIRSKLIPSQHLVSGRLLIAGGQAAGVDIEIVLGSPGRCPQKPVHTIYLPDDSGSVAGVGGNDPIGNRYAEARLAIERVSRRCRCDDELVSVIHFDTPTSADILAAPLNRRGFSSVEDALRVPRDGGGSSLLGPSLEAAYRLADQYPDHEHVLVALTDFQLFDPRVDHVLNRLADFPGIVHAVALRSEPPQLLVEDDRVHVTAVGYGDERGAVARAVFAALTTHRR